MKTSDEWLIIGGGIGVIVLIFQVYNKAKTGGASQPTSFINEAVNPVNSSQMPTLPGAFNFQPPVENINIGGTKLGGYNFNIGVGSGSLFPLFGYAADNSQEANVYNALAQLMQNNANYQQGQNANQGLFLNDNPGLYSNQYFMG